MDEHGICDSAVNFWRPADEASATATAAMFIEWARATGTAPNGMHDPASIGGWWARDRGGCTAAVAAFAGLTRSHGPRANLLRHRGERIALIAECDSGCRRAWSRDALRRGDALPAVVAVALGGMTWDMLAALAASHLLVADIRPDDRVQWLGPPGDPWPLGAWIVGATVILGGAAEAGARCYAAPPPLKVPP